MSVQKQVDINVVNTVFALRFANYSLTPFQVFTSMFRDIKANLDYIFVGNFTASIYQHFKSEIEPL
jgi:hypothetical protein